MSLSLPNKSHLGPPCDNNPDPIYNFTSAASIRESSPHPSSVTKRESVSLLSRQRRRRGNGRACSYRLRTTACFLIYSLHTHTHTHTYTVGGCATSRRGTETRGWIISREGGQSAVCTKRRLACGPREKEREVERIVRGRFVRAMDGWAHGTDASAECHCCL